MYCIIIRVDVINLRTRQQDLLYEIRERHL